MKKHILFFALLFFSQISLASLEEKTLQQIFEESDEAVGVAEQLAANHFFDTTLSQNANKRYDKIESWKKIFQQILDHNLEGSKLVRQLVKEHPTALILNTQNIEPTSALVEAFIAYQRDEKRKSEKKIQETKNLIQKAKTAVQFFKNFCQ